jgi:hypothetical protein
MPLQLCVFLKKQKNSFDNDLFGPIIVRIESLKDLETKAKGMVLHPSLLYLPVGKQ